MEGSEGWDVGWEMRALMSLLTFQVQGKKEVKDEKMLFSFGRFLGDWSSFTSVSGK